MELSFIILISFLGVLLSTPNHIKFSLGAVCNEREREALLTFKKDLKDPSNQLSSWASKDCCRWTGVICNNRTETVVQLHLQSLMLGGELNPSLLELKHLNYLDLSLNDFEGIQIPAFLGSIQNLRYLNLSRAGFGGMIPHQLGNLSSLHYLDISTNTIYEELTVGDLQWLSHLSSLQHLDMSDVNLSKVPNWLHIINMLPSLLGLRLSSCKLGPSMPSLSFVNFTSLAILDLSVNNISSSLPEWLYNLSSLVQLNLDINHFRGIISETVGNLTSLTSLELSSNELEGEIPITLGKLCKLQKLDLSGNKLRGEMSGLLGNSSRCIAGSMKSLNLEVNQLSGPLPDQLGRLKNLDYLSLSNNKFSGSIPLSLGRLSLLRLLDLSYNELNGSLPQSFQHLSSLETLRISYNALEGVVTEAHFANLTRLKAVEMHSLVLKLSPDWVPPFQLKGATFRTCQLGPLFPQWLQTQKLIEEVDLSSTGISTTVPTWFWNMTSQFTYLNLSHNQITGELPNLLKSNSFTAGIYLSSNQFKGRLPRISPDIRELDLSNNSFSGPISVLLCNPVNQMHRLRVLDLSKNLLSGDIPQCWLYWRALKLIRLGSNNITGKIPSSMGALLELRSLHLRNNSLSGELPSSLQNCTELRTIDLGENRFTGSIPTWIGASFRNLIVLRLRLNKFYGVIPQELCHLTSLQLLDIAHNDLSGSIPRCFSNFSAMASKQNSSTSIFYSIVYGEFVETALLVTKGREFEYGNTLTLVTSMDLSKNNLSGEIPKELTSLLGLRSLNLSENLLEGKIPEEIGRMSLLESLDFSKNRLSGLIPQSLVDLTFLSHLNLSYNNLSGKIPLNTQLQGFTELSYMGNHGLCGPPLKNCNGDEQSQAPGDGGRVEEDKDDDWIEMKWFYISLALGFAIGFWGLWGVLVLKNSWRFAYFGFIEDMTDKLCNCCSSCKIR
ncbi:Leucine-rich repeat [Macleaya cordata]|uniref:Leucine-rich repeat n=1 Tax=Macleaya cordata TaxID=56857 RepID=A0A200Q9S8_MACCD|nr:Leucine-rich repeat [Macleaya cordata]